ncbi:MAG: hypothetical protein HW380_793 [Magnetococcales bacterium]|nr:hypothetical protein [Magnetococcales bacterium]
MGERFGKFMGSFVQEMGQTAANRDKGGGTSAGGEGLEWNRRGSGRGEWGSNFRGEERNAPWDRGRGRSYRGAVPMYDPWGANQWGYWNSPLMEYDPWMSSSARADRDWEAWRGYYGAGAVAPWEHEAPWPPGGDRFGPYDGHGPGSYGGWYGNGLGNGGYGPSYGLGERSWGEGGYYPGTRTW